MRYRDAGTSQCSHKRGHPGVVRRTLGKLAIQELREGGFAKFQVQLRQFELGIYILRIVGKTIFESVFLAAAHCKAIEDVCDAIRFSRTAGGSKRPFKLVHGRRMLRRDSQGPPKLLDGFVRSALPHGHAAQIVPRIRIRLISFDGLLKEAAHSREVRV